MDVVEQVVCTTTVVLVISFYCVDTRLTSSALEIC